MNKINSRLLVQQDKSMEDNGKLHTYDEYVNEDYYCRSWISTLKASVFIFSSWLCWVWMLESLNADIKETVHKELNKKKKISVPHKNCVWKTQTCHIPCQNRSLHHIRFLDFCFPESIPEHFHTYSPPTPKTAVKNEKNMSLHLLRLTWFVTSFP